MTARRRANGATLPFTFNDGKIDIGNKELRIGNMLVMYKPTEEGEVDAGYMYLQDGENGGQDVVFGPTPLGKFIFGVNGEMVISSDGMILNNVEIIQTSDNSLFHVGDDTPPVPTRVGMMWISPSNSTIKVCSEAGTPAEGENPEIPATWVAFASMGDLQDALG